MISKADAGFYIFVTAILFSFSSGAIIGGIVDAQYNRELVKRGVRQYNPTTGQVEWRKGTFVPDEN